MMAGQLQLNRLNAEAAEKNQSPSALSALRSCLCVIHSPVNGVSI